MKKMSCYFIIWLWMWHKKGTEALFFRLFDFRMRSKKRKWTKWLQGWFFKNFFNLMFPISVAGSYLLTFCKYAATFSDMCKTWWTYRHIYKYVWRSCSFQLLAASGLTLIVSADVWWIRQLSHTIRYVLLSAAICTKYFVDGTIKLNTLQVKMWDLRERL